MLERLVDGTIAALSPAWAADRAADRLELELLQAEFRGARHTRIDRQAPARRQHANFELFRGQDRLDMVFRARQLENNSAIAEGLLKHETLTGQEVLAIARGDDLDEFRRAQERSAKAKAKEAAAKTAAQTNEREEPDVDLSGAEGLAHP